MSKRTGGCLCGAVRFEAEIAHTDFHTCHCEMCRRWTGSALMAVTLPEAAVNWQGCEHIARYQSSAWAERGWCRRCGSSLFYKVTDATLFPIEWEIPLGLFDDPNGMTMTREIYVDQKTDSFAYAGEREQLTEAQVLALYGVTNEGA